MLRRMAAALFVLGLLPSVLCARTWSAGQSGTYTEGPYSMRYRLYLPANYDPNVEYPMVLFLHGSGERGSDNNIQVNRHISGLIDLTESQYPAILLAPQLPTATSYWSPTNPYDLTPSIMQGVIDSYSVDMSRLYITGLSMGGFGSFNYLDYYYGGGDDYKFAAAVSMHGGYTYTPSPAAVEHFNHLPIWLIHGNNDSVVNFQWSQSTYKSLVGLPESAPVIYNDTLLGYPSAVSGDIRFSAIPGGGHGGWTSLYSRTQLYDWMFAQQVPEPSAIVLASVGLAGIAMLAWKRRRAV